MKIQSINNQYNNSPNFGTQVRISTLVAKHIQSNNLIDTFVKQAEKLEKNGKTDILDLSWEKSWGYVQGELITFKKGEKNILPSRTQNQIPVDIEHLEEYYQNAQVNGKKINLPKGTEKLFPYMK